MQAHCQGCDFSQFADDKTAATYEGQTAHGDRCLHQGGEGLLPAPSSHQEVSSLYPCLVAFARPDGGTAASRTMHSRYPVSCSL